MDNIREKYKLLQRQIRLNNKPEIWKDIPWYEGLYQVSNKGNVKSLWNSKTKKDKILKYSKYINGYCRINLYIRWIAKIFYIHRLVCLTFLDNPKNKEQVNHIDWDKYNNNLENLEFCTASENILHSYRILWNKLSNKNNFKVNHPDKWKFWKDNRKSKKVNQYNLLGNLIKTWDSLSDVMRDLWIFKTNISACCKWIQKTAWGFIWRYV
jgi:hypothetical protein